ncbi:MAG: PIN domain-containing protein [Acidobacteria bacterium]|nr:PIN domain-containing protein [Acidobacteriota bacterium]
MIVVDTSVWIDALRQPGREEADVLRQLIDADLVALPVPVRSELLIGTGGRTRDRLARTLLALPVIYPTDDTWTTLDQWTKRADEAGERFSMADLLIGVLASTEQALVWSADDAFRRMAALELITLYR